jgi:septal ring factor EnvC (AmiA/AmiB activator)
MSTPLEVVSGNHLPRNANAPVSPKKSYKLFVFAWIILVICGLTGAYYYTNHLKDELTANLAQQNQVQLQAVQADYQKQLEDLKVNVNQEMANLQTKVDQLNQLLAFTKDNASAKTDSSNQLYTQLADVKKKLEELQKNLDVLK